MKLRELMNHDVPRMLEWMHRPELVQYFSHDFLSATKETVGQFINDAQTDKSNLHYAIVDEFDQYLGTISLKSIDLKNQNSEYAISLHPDAIGAGVAKQATDKILHIAFNDLKLSKVYLNVVSDNIRANRFYEKYGFVYEGTFKQHVSIRGQLFDLKWYAMFHDAFGGMF